MKYIYTSCSPRDTLELGIRLGKLLEPGDTVCLEGGLGAGKTLLTKGIALGMGIGHPVTSPTFTLINEYPGEIPLYHFDLFRLEESDELCSIGGEELLYDRGVCVLEWASRGEDILPRERLWINIALNPGENRKRLIEISAVGDRYESMLRGVREYEDAGH